MIPLHWRLSGPGPAQDAKRIFRWVKVAGGRASTVRRLIRVGPFAFYVLRYEPDAVAEMGTRKEAQG